MLKSQPLVPQNETEFRDRAFKEVVKMKWGCEGGPWSDMAGVLYEEIKMQIHTEGMPAEETQEKMAICRIRWQA